MLGNNILRAARQSFATLFLIATVLASAAALDARIAPAAANWTGGPKYAAIVVDENTNEVLFSRNADAPRYPASLTKIMTLYLLFEAIQEGRTSLDSKIVFSKHASSQPPSKLGVKPGGSIPVKAAIMMLVTKSANDVAAAIGEHLAGTEAEFARLMTAKARELGMTKTTFRNASGLPHSGQKTTARDMARLGHAIQTDFPEEYKFFKTRSYSFMGRNFRNHNRLLGRVTGVDGIKTGYINASGFNLTTSAKRGEKHIVAVVMGGPTGRIRDNHMANLIERHFPRASNWPRIVLPKVAPLPPRREDGRMIAVAAATGPASPLPPTKPRVLDNGPVAPVKAVVSKPETVKLASTDDVIAAKIAEEAPRAAAMVVSSRPVLDDTGRPMAEGDAELPDGDSEVTGQSASPDSVVANASTDPIGTLLETKTTLVRSDSTHASIAALGQAPEGVEAGKKVTTAIARKLTGQSWLIQIGAYDSEKAARERIEDAKQRASLLKTRLGYTEAVDVKNSKLFRARFAGFERDDAEKACKILKQAKFGCLALKQ